MCCLILIWPKTDDDTYCYKFVQEDVTWHDAEKACEKEEGRLASIHNPAENTFIGLKFQAMDVDEGWMGLNDRNGEGTFEWIDSSPADFFHWGINGEQKLLSCYLFRPINNFMPFSVEMVLLKIQT